MSVILNVVLPVFAIVLAGYLAGRFRYLGDGGSEIFNAFVMNVALPALLFRAMANADANYLFNGPFLLTYMGGQATLFLISLVIAQRVFKARLGAACLSATAGIYSNTGYMGIPLVLAAFGEVALPPAVLATAINASLVIAVTIAIIETDLSVGGGPLGVARDVGKAMIKTPVLVAPVLGIAWSLSGLELPQSADAFAKILGDAAAPCALFSLGLFLVGKPLSEGATEVGVMTLMKLIIHPFVTWLLASWLLADQPMWATIAVLMAAVPTGANLFIIARKYDLYVVRTSSAILATTVGSVLTLSVLFVVFADGF